MPEVRSLHLPEGDAVTEPTVECFAIFGAGRRYRYVLRRKFLPETGAPLRLCVWLNPSTADEKDDDASVRVGMGFARRWGDGGILIINLGDLVETYSQKLPERHEERVGPFHVAYMLEVFRGEHGVLHPDVLCGWGDEGAGPLAEDMVMHLRRWTFRPVALALTKSGNPGHPLRKKADLVPFAFRTPQEEREALSAGMRARRAP